MGSLTLIQLRDKIDAILEKRPEYANCDRIGIVTDVDEETGFKEMEWLVDFKTICCDGQGMAAIQMVMEDDKYFGFT